MRVNSTVACFGILFWTSLTGGGCNGTTSSEDAASPVDARVMEASANNDVHLADVAVMDRTVVEAGMQDTSSTLDASAGLDGPMIDVSVDGPWDIAPLPAPGTDGVVYLSDLQEISGASNAQQAPGAANGTLPIGKDATGHGNPLVIAGVYYAKGLGCRAVSVIEYDLGGQYSRFVADMGLDTFEHGTPTGYDVRVDGNLVFDQGTLTSTDVLHIDVSVAGAHRLQLYMRTQDNGPPDHDYAIWGGARLYP